MINPFIIKKWGALLLTGLGTTIGFYTGLVMGKSLTYGLIAMGVGIFVTALISNVLLKTPFRDMLEGKGVIAFDMNSTGILRPFILRVLPPYVEGQIWDRTVSDVFDRSMVFNLVPPTEAGTIQQGAGKDGQVRTCIVLDEEEYNKGRFGLNHFPCVIYNSQLNTIITKDWLSDKEKNSFAEHTVLYLNRKMEELTSAMLNFGRYVVETTRPKKPFLSARAWTIIIIIVGLIILGYFLLPMIFPAMKQAGGTILSGAGNAAGSIQKVS